MSAGLNKVMLIGNLGKDPESRITEGGVKRVNFSMATTETYKDKSGNKVEQTEWHYVVLWRGIADIAEKYLKKGTTIYLEGKIQNRKWTDQSGQEKRATEIVGEHFQILKQPGASNNQGSNTYTAPADNFGSTGGDDLPF